MLNVDNYMLFEDDMIAQDERIKKLPVCIHCEEAIQDEEAYYINGEWICERCMQSFLREVEAVEEKEEW